MAQQAQGDLALLDSLASLGLFAQVCQPVLYEVDGPVATIRLPVTG